MEFRMNKKQLDERRGSRRVIFKFYMFMVAAILLVGAPFDYFIRHSTFAFYAGLVLLAISVAFFAFAEIREMIQGRVVDD
jgi:hypothetical protein